MNVVLLLVPCASRLKISALRSLDLVASRFCCCFSSSSALQSAGSEWVSHHHITAKSRRSLNLSWKICAQVVNARRPTPIVTSNCNAQICISLFPELVALGHTSRKRILCGDARHAVLHFPNLRLYRPSRPTGYVFDFQKSVIPGQKEENP